MLNAALAAGFTAEEFEEKWQQHFGPKQHPKRVCVNCDSDEDIKGFFGQKYCKRHLVIAKQAHRKFSKPVGRYGAKTGG